MGFAGGEEARGGGLRSEVALRRGEEFVADHELSNCGGTEQRREIMSVQMPRLVWLAVGRPLMKTHGVRESRFEEIVVADGNAAKNVAEKISLAGVELV